MSFLGRLFSKYTKEEGGANRGRDFRRAFPGMAPPRLHPYRFAHYGLPAAVFEDPGGFLDRMRSGDGEAWLTELWRRVGARAVIEENARRVPCVGLTLTQGEIEGVSCPIVVMPAPEGPTEAFFAAIVPPLRPEDEVRYFLLEREEGSTTDDPSGLLCEWFSDGSRTNHLWLMPASLEFFEEAIATQLGDEFRRRQAGVLPVGMPRWKSDEDPAIKIDERPAHFRPQHVLFAYDVVPKAADRLREAEDPRSLLNDLWEEAGSRAERAGKPSGAPPEGLDARVVEVAGTLHLLIALPEPIGAPEAYFVLVSLGEGSAEVYTLERPCARRGRETIVGQINPENHAVCTWSEDATVESFLDTVKHVRAGMSRPEPPYDMLGQLLLYRPVYRLIRESDPEATDT